MKLQIHWWIYWFIFFYVTVISVTNRISITNSSVVKIPNLVMNYKSEPVEMNFVTVNFINFELKFVIILTFISWFQYSFVFDLIAILTRTARTDTPGLLKIILSWKNVNDVIISIHEVINKTSLYDANYIVDMVVKPKFGDTSISMTEISKISVFKIFSEKNIFSRGGLDSSSII